VLITCGLGCVAAHLELGERLANPPGEAANVVRIPLANGFGQRGSTLTDE
jgi:hypothetical protein